MKKQKKNQTGITLIALVISIIIMLILAGVSLNAMVGDNGILTQAQAAKLAQELAQEQEELEYMLANYNIDSESIGTVDEFLQGKVADGELDKFTMIPDPNNASKRVRMIQKGENFYYILEDGDYYKLQKINTDVSGGIGEGYTIVTANNFVGGTMDFNPGEGKTATLIFNDRIDADYNFNVTSGEVTIYIDNNMRLTNENIEPARSAINIEPNATLNLHIADNCTLTVNSGFGATVPINVGNGAIGGNGGYAGIRVPWIDSTTSGTIGERDEGEYATLNIYGASTHEENYVPGKLIAYGGNAGDGGTAISNNAGGGGGGRSWCRNWW